MTSNHNRFFASGRQRRSIILDRANGAERLFELVTTLSAVAGIGILVMGMVVRRHG